MATGRRTQLIGQFGEYMVAAELCRRGLITTTFTANIPHYDIIASDEKGKHLNIQIKAIKGSSWQFNVETFWEIEFDGDVQNLRNPKMMPYPNLILVFLKVRDYGEDQFYILDWVDLQRIIGKGYKDYLDKHDGVRPKNPKSTHTALRPAQLEINRDNWELIVNRLRD